MKREMERLIKNKNFCDIYPSGGWKEGRRDEDKDETIKLLLKILKSTSEKKSWEREIIDEVGENGGELWEKIKEGIKEVIKEGKDLYSNCGDGEEDIGDEEEIREEESGRREGNERKKSEERMWGMKKGDKNKERDEDLKEHEERRSYENLTAPKYEEERRGKRRKWKGEGLVFQNRSGGRSQVTSSYCNHKSKNKVDKREKQKESGLCEVE